MVRVTGPPAAWAVLWTLVALLPVRAQVTSAALVVRALAEVTVVTRQDAGDAVRLAPAERVVPGDEVIYTLEIRNAGAAPIAAPQIIEPVPAHMSYVADSAAGPGAEVSYSVDGGHRFDRPEHLRVVGEDGRLREADARDYTHIRWILKNSLKVNSVAFARFRAVVK